jgi:hypothetical protein
METVAPNTTSVAEWFLGHRPSAKRSSQVQQTVAMAPVQQHSRAFIRQVQRAVDPHTKYVISSVCVASVAVAGLGFALSNFR